ncbi:MAG: HAD-IA family hydrolase [Gemmatimonadota bacterium]
MRLYRTVLFDLDGTLIDSRDLILASYRHTMRVHLGQVPPDSAWLRTMGTPLVAQFRDFARHPAEARAMLTTYREHNQRVHDDLVGGFRGVPETVAWLRHEGFRLGLVTSKSRDGAVRGLDVCGIRSDWFGAIVTADDPVPHKPDPAPVRLALEQLGEETPERAVFVGDSVWDLRAGRAAGTATAAAVWGPFDRALLAAESPDFLLDRIEEVCSVVARTRAEAGGEPAGLAGRRPGPATGPRGPRER